MIFALYEHPDGVEVDAESEIVYDLASDRAASGPARVDGPAVVWRLHGGEGQVTLCHKGVEAALAEEVRLDAATGWVVRCDRVDFPPGGVAYRHVHPGPGIRRLLCGELTIASPEGTRTYSPGDAWFEDRDHPVLATGSPTEDTAFVRVLLLPREWQGRRTIRYLDPADEERPKLQRATILLEEPVEL